MPCTYGNSQVLIRNSMTKDPRNYPVVFTLLVLIFCTTVGTLISLYLGLSRYPPLVFSALIFLIALCCRCPNDMLLTSKIDIKSLRLYWPIPIYLLVTPLLFGGYRFDQVNSSLIKYMTGVGFFEELLMHSFCLGLMLRILRKTGKFSYQSVVKAAIVSSTLFGIFHLFMILQKPSDIHWIALRISTVFFAFFMNLGFAGLALRTNSVWPAVFFYATVDIVCFNVGDAEVISRVLSGWWFTEGLIAIFLTMPFGLYGIWLIDRDFAEGNSQHWILLNANNLSGNNDP